MSWAMAFCVDSIGQSVLCCLGLALRLDLKGLTVGDQRPSSVGRMLYLPPRKPGCSWGRVPGDLGAFRISDCATLILRLSGQVVRLHPFQPLSAWNTLFPVSLAHFSLGFSLMFLPPGSPPECTAQSRTTMSLSNHFSVFGALQTRSGFPHHCCSVPTTSGCWVNICWWKEGSPPCLEQCLTPSGHSMRV